MDWRQEAIDKLTGYEAQRQAADKLPAGPKRTEAQLWASLVEGGMSVLTDEERLVLELLFIRKAKGGVDRLCDLLSVGKSGVYTRRDKEPCAVSPWPSTVPWRAHEAVSQTLGKSWAGKAVRAVYR